ncbi:hypothetical protein ACOCJ4_11380 [Knoellia sp. CPCC 206435]|uniref:hypothetical protein n=1 Tax=Knoellia terrae TaxID=3404797 RepID=UPI003B4280E6
MRPSPPTAAFALLSVLSVAACGTDRPPATGGVGASAATSASGPEVTAQGTLMQDSSTSPVELCVGPVVASHPPQCSGPTLVGDVDWDAVGPERALGRTFSSSSVWVVGRFDPDAGRWGTVTLTRPVSRTAPPGVSVPSPTARTFPQLCDDPYGGGGRAGGGSADQQNALHELLPTIDGYVTSWVSDGSSLLNVLVTGDADPVLSELRRHWTGGLCVERRDLPTEKEVFAARDALRARFDILSMGGGGSTGGLDVHVMALDTQTLEEILGTVRPWLAPEHVRVTSEFQPVPL